MKQPFQRASPHEPSADSEGFLGKRFITYDKNPLKLHERFVKSVGRFALVGTLGIGAALSYDSAHQEDLTSRAYVDTLPSTNEQERGRSLIVFAPGMMSAASLQAAPIEETLLTHGDLDYVEQRGETYDSEEVVETTSSYIAKQLQEGDYEEVTIVGASMGGRVAHDVLESLDKKNELEYVKVNLLLVDAPTAKSDISTNVRIGGGLGGGLPFGPLINKIPVGKILAPIDERYFDPDYDKKAMDDGMRYIHTTTPSDMSRQAKYVLGDPLPDDSLKGIVDSVAYIQSTGDEFVSPAAIEHWENITGQSISVQYVQGGPHTGFDTRPAAYNEALKESFDALNASS